MSLPTIYIAGHTGLIGSAALRRFAADANYRVLTASHGALDLQDAATVQRFFDSHAPDYVILAAGKVGGILENRTYPADFISSNLAIQLNVLAAAHRTGVKKLLLFASSCMYPRECPQPMKEDRLFSGLPEPTSMAYAVSKMAGLQLCLAYNQQYGHNRFIPLIPNSVYGPNDNFDPDKGHVLSALIRRFHDAKVKAADRVLLWGSGRPRREFIHADDVAECCAHLIAQDTSGLELPLNVGSGHDLAIRDLAELVATAVDYRGEIAWDPAKPDGAPRKLLDSSRLRSTGWSAGIALQTGVAETYAWYRKNVKTAEAAV
ncbi:GDP-L-fucose synthase [Bradyrhizobium diazoefficiens]|jgi:GDP-L-fucose synthase|nr:GDP-L-fucose synthase [Bradyrhizobium diazoefficiens]MBR0962698.1 GDP-L-fucose synthase [Bradyrhizobium diazoefficiens]MBR0976858.1 GDP-L-fucose synthase [Bradyrhizobium diazoefficiens]MBR1005503.1 GDP-L-fucose synthase [Bradyrhizobium diazoefficiens]MBR1011976.1 GDP-L-fucose synthase [Bradyrhizobium diazoefficiens]MBR1049317.1 GDP-L-fucose synthase [Bradyrhizobium diazoefficiens]